jgi:hypothetical protein
MRASHAGVADCDESATSHGPIAFGHSGGRRTTGDQAGDTMKYLEDVFYLVLLMLLMPLWIALVWIALSVILVRQTYWWIRGNSTPLTRRQGRPRRPWLDVWPWSRARVPAMPRPKANADLAHIAAALPHES